jgi:hypothetical protein
MPPLQSNTHKLILAVTGIAVLAMSVILFFIPPALFPDPGMGLQVLRCMQMGGSFNTLTAPDQSDIAQNYNEYLTWWSPGQYLVPYFFTLITGLTLGKAIAITVGLCELSGLAGFYYFFKKIGFTPMIAACSLVFIICQQAFMVPYVFYPGGELLIFAFEGWFLYGCISLKKPGLTLVLFVLLSGWIGFFSKSSFLWIYAAGLFCLWFNLSKGRFGVLEWIKKGLWIGVPAVISLACIYVFFLSKGTNPASASQGVKLTLQTFSFPLASPLLSAFSVDDMLHGLLFHTGKVLLNDQWSLALLVLLAILSIVVVIVVSRRVRNQNYKLFLVVFYITGVLFLGFAYLRQLTISYEARHFRIIGLLLIPGLIYWISGLKNIYKGAFVVIIAAIGFVSFSYLFKGYSLNNNVSARGNTGIAQPGIDQASLNIITKLDRNNRNAVFVFVGDELGLEVLHNRTIMLQPIGDDLKIDIDDYKYDGFAGPLYIVLPESYNGPKEKMIMKSFPGYTGFNVSMLSDKYVLYEAKMKRGK